MPRYFIEVGYKGTRYSGFQVQENANSIQAEVEKALRIFFRKEIPLTGSSRTDAGVHALQNFFHGDFDVSLPFDDCKYNLNALLPRDIVIKNFVAVKENAHCRFDALSREYKYFIYRNKDPFLQETAFYYPYVIDIRLLKAAARCVMLYDDFSSFSKKNTQVNNFICRIEKSEWVVEGEMIFYRVRGNRFLRGMVKGLTGTMLRVSAGKISLDEFCKIIESRDQSRVDFSPPSHGLFLISVKYPAEIQGAG